MRKNKLRELLRNSQPSIGTHVYAVWPGLVEVIGHAGTIDYIEFLAEYAPYSLHDLENWARAIELFDMSSMIKIDKANQLYVAQKAIGSGIQNILFVDVKSVKEVEECVRAVRADTESIGGLYGAVDRRNVRWGLEPMGKNYVKALDEVVVAIMIEKKSALEEIEGICNVKGVDMVQFGPCDFAMNIDRPGQSGEPDIKEAEKKMIRAALAAGVEPRVEIGYFDDDRCKEYMDLGVKHFSIGWDVDIIFNWMKKHGGNLREALDKKLKGSSGML